MFIIRKTPPQKPLKWGLVARIGDFVFWMNAVSGASVVKYNSKDDASMDLHIIPTVHNQVAKIKPCFAIRIRLSTYVCTSSDLNYNSIPFYV